MAYLTTFILIEFTFQWYTICESIIRKKYTIFLDKYKITLKINQKCLRKRLYHILYTIWKEIQCKIKVAK